MDKIAQTIVWDPFLYLNSFNILHSAFRILNVSLWTNYLYNAACQHSI